MHDPGRLVDPELLHMGDSYIASGKTSAINVPTGEASNHGKFSTNGIEEAADVDIYVN